MEAGSRRLRDLQFGLTDIESRLRASGRPVGSESIGSIIKRLDALTAPEFLNECRARLEGVLVGERDLPIEIIGEIFDAIAAIDELLRAPVR